MHYQGTAGIPVGGFFRRLVFAYRYRDINLLISGLINKNSKILINRDIGTRVSKAAPFLKYDADPYAAIVGGRLYYIWDAYTTTDLFPNAAPYQPVDSQPTRLLMKRRQLGRGPGSETKQVPAARSFYLASASTKSLPQERPAEPRDR